MSDLQGGLDMFHILDYVGSPRFDFYRSQDWLVGQEKFPWMRMVPEIMVMGSVYPYRRYTELDRIWRAQIEAAIAQKIPVQSALEETERLYNQVLR